MTEPVSPSLLYSVRGLIERTYGTDSGVADLHRYVVGDEGYRRIVRRRQVVRGVGPEDHPEAGAGDAPGPRVLLRGRGERTAVALYFPDALIRRLEADPPTLRLHDRNIDDFAHFVEEVDHFVAVAHGLNQGRPLQILELELRANVSKALVIRHFLGRLAGRGWLEPQERIWVRHHLFEKNEFRREPPPLRQRYLEARRLALRFLDRLDALAPALRIRELRRWVRLSPQMKLRELAAS